MDLAKSLLFKFFFWNKKCSIVEKLLSVDTVSVTRSLRERIELRKTDESSGKSPKLFGMHKVASVRIGHARRIPETSQAFNAKTPKD